jgi:hypothetical protein
MGDRRRSRVLAGTACVGVAVVLAVALGTDLQAHARNRDEHASLTAARTTLATQRTDLAVTRYVTAVTTGRRDSLRTSVASTLGQIASTQGTLHGADVTGFLQAVDIGTLHTCLGGVRQSLQLIGTGDGSGAAQAISGVAAACSTVEGGTSDGLAYPFDFPDPDVILVGSTYYAYATNSVAGNIQIISSTDLTHWTAVGDALPSLPTWATTDETWAPSVLQVGATFVLYYSVRVAGPGGGGAECISVATATQPQGPFTDSSTGPVECQPTLGGSIDPSIFVDATGTPYLVWKSNGGGGASAIWSQQLDPTGTAFAPATQPVQLLVPDQSWEGGVIEAPDLVAVGGRYYLFYSGNLWKTASYGVGVATCAGPLGPCTKAPGPILASDSGMKGPGGASVFADASGTLWIAFHAWAPDAVGYPNSRSLYLRKLSTSGAVPTVAPGA